MVNGKALTDAFSFEVLPRCFIHTHTHTYEHVDVIKTAGHVFVASVHGNTAGGLISDRIGSIEG